MLPDNTPEKEMTPKKGTPSLFYKLLDKTLRIAAQRRHPEPGFQQPLDRIVILARECYGDAILLTPLIARLRARYPHLDIYVVTFTRIIFNFFSADPNVTAVYHAKRNLKRYVREVLTKKFDLLFNPKDHPSTFFFIHSLLIRARYKVSHRNINHEGLYNHLIDLPPGTHESVRNLALLTVIDPATPLPRHDRPYLPPMPVSDEITTFLHQLQPQACIGINISAGHKGGYRTWEQWSELIRSFPDEQFVIFSAPNDIEEKRKLEQPHHNVLPSPSTRNIYEVWNIISKLRLLVTPDTSLVHIAACSDTPLIALYRKYLADRTQFGPLSTLQDVIVSPTPSVIDIDTASVTASLEKMLKRLSMSQSATPAETK